MRKDRFLWLVSATSGLVVLVFLYSTVNAEEQLSATADTSAKVGEPSPKKYWELGARVSYWFSNISGNVRVDSNVIQGTTIDLKNDLGIDRSYMGYFEIYGQFGRHHLTAGYVDTDYSGSTNIPRTLIFGGKTYPAGSLVQAEIKLKVIDFEYLYDFLRFDQFLSGLSFGGIGKIMYVEGHTSSFAPALALSGQGSFYAPIPMLGLGARLGLLGNWLEVRGKATGSNFSGNTFYEADAALALRLIPFTELSGGYRVIRYDYEKNNLFFNVKLSGPYVGLTILF